MGVVTDIDVAEMIEVRTMDGMTVLFRATNGN